MLEDLYTREELAKKLKVSLPTIDRWRREGLIKSVKVKGSVRFKESQIKKLLKNR